MWEVGTVNGQGKGKHDLGHVRLTVRKKVSITNITGANMNDLQKKPQSNIGAVRRSFWCAIGFHKLRYIKKYCYTANIQCERCGKKWIEGYPGLLFRQW